MPSSTVTSDITETMRNHADRDMEGDDPGDATMAHTDISACINTRECLAVKAAMKQITGHIKMLITESMTLGNMFT